MRLILMLLMFTTPFMAISQKQVAQDVMKVQAAGGDFVQAKVFTFETTDATKRASELEGLTKATILKLDKVAIQSLRANGPSNLKMAIPTSENSDIVLNLVEHDIFTPNFRLNTDKGVIDYVPGRHYRGMVNGDENSVVAISIYDNEIMGLISTNAGNQVLGRLQNSDSDDHVLYFDNNLPQQSTWECGTPDDDAPYKKKDLVLQSDNRDIGDCIKLYIEIDNDIVSQKGGAVNATNYVTGLFNQSITLYANDDMAMSINEIFAWTGSSPYSSTSSSGMLSDFQSNISSINGNLGHLVSYQASGGIAAGFSGICASNVDNSLCFSSIDASYSNVPTYSWSVMVVTHEMGHLIGSRHTHACVWNGNNTAIDGCSGSTEGSCSLPGNPSGGGTIMSYCHLTSVGINLNNGFGPQPKAVVNNSVNGAGNCLTPCGAPSCTDGFQNGDETGVDCGGSCPDACPTCSDGVQNGEETGVDCGGPDCAPCPCIGTNVTLTIVLDNYPEETTWSIESGGNTVASGGTYGSQPDGSTVVEVACLADGCYDFVINDSYGDGICCAYGSGSYSLSDGANTLASGGSFGSSETTNFCVGGGSGPTCTDGIQNGDETGVDCGGSTCPACPTCSDGVQNGNETGIDCGGPDCDACPTCNDGIQNGGETDVDCGGPDCDACPTCTDGVQNGDETGVDCGGPDCDACPTGGLIFGSYFESNYDGWIDGGSDCGRINSSSRAWEGNYSIRIRDNSNSSVLTRTNVPVAGLSSVSLEFYFYPNSMESGEDFWVQTSTGGSWTTVASYASGTSFSNGSFYVATVVIPVSSSTIDLRFRCDASGNYDQIYIDEVTLTGSGGSQLVESSQTIKEVKPSQELELGSEIPTFTEDALEINVFPNPAQDLLNLDFNGVIQSMKVISMQGRIMSEARISQNMRSIDIDRLPQGMYFVMIEKDGEMIPKKFMKM